jgi:hypothetical protein
MTDFRLSIWGTRFTRGIWTAVDIRRILPPARQQIERRGGQNDRR